MFYWRILSVLIFLASLSANPFLQFFYIRRVPPGHLDRWGWTKSWFRASILGILVTFWPRSLFQRILPGVLGRRRWWATVSSHRLTTAKRSCSGSHMGCFVLLGGGMTGAFIIACCCFSSPITLKTDIFSLVTSLLQNSFIYLSIKEIKVFFNH